MRTFFLWTGDLQTRERRIPAGRHAHVHCPLCVGNNYRYRRVSLSALEIRSRDVAGIINSTETRLCRNAGRGNGAVGLQAYGVCAHGIRAYAPVFARLSKIRNFHSCRVHRGTVLRFGDYVARRLGLNNATNGARHGRRLDVPMSQIPRKESSVVKRTSSHVPSPVIAWSHVVEDARVRHAFENNTACIISIAAEYANSVKIRKIIDIFIVNFSPSVFRRENFINSLIDTILN